MGTFAKVPAATQDHVTAAWGAGEIKGCLGLLWRLFLREEVPLPFPLLHSAAWDAFAVAEALAALLDHEEEGPTQGTVQSDTLGPWSLSGVPGK